MLKAISAVCPGTGYHSIDDALHGVVNVEEDTAGDACGRSVRNPFAEAIVTGKRALHARPAGRRMRCISRFSARRIRMRAIKSYQSRSRPLQCPASSRCSPDTSRASSTSTATHEDHLVDPDDTYMLDNVVRFVGQRVAAVVAETESAAEAPLPPARGRLRAADCLCSIPKLPCCRGRRSCMRRARRLPRQCLCRHPRRARQCRGRALPQADAIHEMTYSTSRGQHVHLETHGRLRGVATHGRLHVRTSSQAPFIAKQKLCLPARAV